jgi:hypothetical protein
VGSIINNTQRRSVYLFADRRCGGDALALVEPGKEESDVASITGGKSAHSILVVDPQARRNATQGVDLTCPFAVSVSISPGLGLTSQSQSVTGSLKGGTDLLGATPCSSITGTPYHGATGIIKGSGSQDCLLQGSLSGTIDVTWDNGDTSTITWSDVIVLFVPVVRASITSGALKGDTIVVAGLPTGFAGTCVLAPVDSLSLIGVAAFLPLG